MDTTIFRSIIIRSVMILSLFVLLSGCSDNGDDSKVNDENVNLTTLKLSSGTLSPLFDANTIAYSVEVANNVSSITVTPTAADTNSTITVNGQAVSSGSASQSINLPVGLTTITIVVTAQDGTTTKTYTVAITRLEGVSHNADLAGLSLSEGGILSPAFTANRLAYTAEVADDVSSIKATPTAADATSIITVNGQAVSSGTASQSMNLSVGPNTVTIVVTAQDETTTKTYTVVITRLAGVSHNADLAGITLSTGSALSPAFDPSKTAYTALVPNDISSITVTPTAADSNSTITVNGEAVISGTPSQSIDLDVGPNTITTVVTAQDGTTTKTYTVTVTRNNGFWTWVSGDDTTNQSGIYGTMGGADPVNIPGSRYDSISWTDSSGNLWLFGGYGYDSEWSLGYLNDLWKFNGTDWTWVSGDKTVRQSGIYGSPGVADPANKPGSRYRSISWTDSSGNLWLFGGSGLDSAGNYGNLNDLWKLEP